MVGASGTVAGTTLFDDADAELVPMALVAVTAQVYVLPLVRLATTNGLVDPDTDPVVPPLEEVQVAV